MRSRLLLLLLLAVPLGAQTPAAVPLRLAGDAFGHPAEIEVRDLPRAEAEAAIRDGFAELEQARSEARALESAAVSGRPVALDPAAAELLRRAQAFCLWSEGAIGPLGGRIYELWGLWRPAPALPTPADLAAAVESARCDRMAFDAAATSLTVAEGSRLELFPFALGWAVDRAAERLRAHGAGNFWIEAGPLARGVGPGPGGAGWPVAPRPVPGLAERPEPFFLRDRALATFAADDHALTIAGERFAPYIDQRTGRPGRNIATLMVVTELAIDAQGVADAMFALGPSEGMMLVGSLQPRPGIRWYLGSGEGPPVISDVNWTSTLRR